MKLRRDKAEWVKVEMLRILRKPSSVKTPEGQACQTYLRQAGRSNVIDFLNEPANLENRNARGRPL